MQIMYVVYIYVCMYLVIIRVMMPSLRSMKELQEKNGIIISRVRHRSKTTRNVKISDKGRRGQKKETHNGLEHNGDGKECEEEESKEFGHGWSELKLFLRSAGNGAKSVKWSGEKMKWWMDIY